MTVPAIPPSATPLTGNSSPCVSTLHALARGDWRVVAEG